MRKRDARGLHVGFSFHVSHKESFESRRLLGTTVTEETVPEGRDPVEYLRERVLSELDRLTLRGVEPAARRDLVQLFDPEPVEAEEE